MGITLSELAKRVKANSNRKKSSLKVHYELAKRLGFTGSEASILQAYKREVIIVLAIERGLIKDANDSKAV